jgi:Zn finger protein HypA/HybF involved in hydrogenase expression
MKNRRDNANIKRCRECNRKPLYDLFHYKCPICGKKSSHLLLVDHTEEQARKAWNELNKKIGK